MTHNIKQIAAGQWESIIDSLAPGLKPALERKGKHLACPVHSGKDGFRLFKNVNETGGGICNSCGTFADGFSLLMWINSWTFAEAAKAVENFLKGKTNNNIISFKSPKVAVNPNNYERAAHALRAIIHKSNPINNLTRDAQPVAKYLVNRGLKDAIKHPPKDLLFNSKMPYFHDSKIVGYYPCLIAIIRNARGKIVSLHRTYLTQDGHKAPVPEPKKLMSAITPGAISGAAVRLYPASNVLAVCEGIETSIATYLATGWPVWSCISASGLANVILPSEIKTLYIMADKDRSKRGEQAALQLASRYSHIETNIYQPAAVIPSNAKSIDWADVLTNSAGVA